MALAVVVVAAVVVSQDSYCDCNSHTVHDVAADADDKVAVNDDAHD